MNDLLSLALPFVALMVFFYFMALRPQAKQRQAREAMLNALKAGDEIETVGRIFGRIVSIHNQTLTVQVGTGVQDCIKLHREGVARIVKDTKEAKDDKDAKAA